MKKLLVLLILGLPFFASAQFEAGLTCGISNYIGDLSPSPFQNVNLMAGGFGRYNVGDFVSIKGALTFTTLSGSDANSSNELRQLRNLSFKTSLVEIAVTGEFNLLGYQPYGLSRTFSPYLFAGVGGFFFNPRGRYQGEWVSLQPLHTEGQGMAEFPNRHPYSLVQICIPMGFGVKYAINDQWNVGAEVGVRKTFTDYLDDVSLSYVDAGLFDRYYGENSLNAALSNRTGELSPDRIPATLNYHYDRTVKRGDDSEFDWYLLVGVSVSYNFLDNGLVGSRHRRGGGNKGCKGARF